jgi:hypothetical protein
VYFRLLSLLDRGFWWWAIFCEGLVVNLVDFEDRVVLPMGFDLSEAGSFLVVVLGIES